MQPARAKHVIVTRVLCIRTLAPGETKPRLALQLFVVQPSESDDTHYVILDRDGWRCLHGPDCQAVWFAKQFAWATDLAAPAH